MDLDTFQWKVLEVTSMKPEIRSRHVAFRWNHILVVHGGSDKSTFFGDVWGFDVENLKWMHWSNKISFIEPRRDHCSVVFNGKVFLFNSFINLF